MAVISESVPSDADDVEEDVAGTSISSGPQQIIMGKLSGTEYAVGLRFTTIGPSGGDTIDDANLRWGNRVENLESGDEIQIHCDTASSAAWSGSDRPTQITKSTNFTLVDASAGVASDVTHDVTAMLQEWVDAGGYDGDARFGCIANPGTLANFDNVQISDTGAAGGSTPWIPVLEGNYSAPSAGGETPQGRARSYMRLLHH